MIEVINRFLQKQASVLRENRSVWFSDGNKYPFYVRLRKQYAVKKEELVEGAAYVVAESCCLYRNGSATGYFCNGSVLIVGKKDAEGNYEGSKVTGKTFRVTQDASIGNTPAQWSVNENDFSEGKMLVEGLRFPQIIPIDIVLKELEEVK